MLGAIIGDIVGSRFEWHNIKTKEFELFTRECRPTDDSVMTLAVARAIMHWNHDRLDDLKDMVVMSMREMGNRYPNAGYGGTFARWLTVSDPQPYNSWGNGSAMRVSPCAYFAASLEEALEMAKAVTEVTHNHPEGIKGAQAVTAAIFLALHGSSIEEIRQHISQNYYSMDFTLDEIRPTYEFDVSCQGSVPQAIMAFLESTSFEDAIRNAVSIGGDSDTIAAITGSIAGAYYVIPENIATKVMEYLSNDMITILNQFSTKLENPDACFDTENGWYDAVVECIETEQPGTTSMIMHYAQRLYWSITRSCEFSHYCWLMKIIRSDIGEEAFFQYLSDK